MECLDHIIGVSRTECECIDANIDSEDRKSKSGIYLDEVEGGLKMTALDKMDCQTFVEKSKRSIKRAKDMFIEQIIAAYSTSDYRRSYEDFNGRIGKVTHLKTLTNLKQYAGLSLQPGYIRGAKMIVKKIGLIISQQSDVQLQVYRSDGIDDDIELIETVVIPTLANIRSVKELDEPLILPFSDDRGLPLKYYLVYDTIEYGLPRDNQAACNCGRMGAILKTYLKSGGVSANGIQDLDTAKPTDYANGVYLDAEINCSNRDMVCNLLKLDDSNTIAHSIAYKAQELLIEDLMGSGNINKYTMLSKEYLWGKRNHFRKEFDDRILWLSQTKPVEQVSDCLACHDNRIMKTLIR